jgi:hypothetical protein
MNASNFRPPNEEQDIQHEDPAGLGPIPQTLQDDSPLLELDKQFTDLMSEILAVEREYKENVHGRSTAMAGRRSVDVQQDEETITQQIESVLSRLEQIERNIMLTPAHTIVGLGVKARHAAYVTSEYWSAPIDRIDWDAQAVRLLIEAVCKFARMPLPFQDREAC